MQHTQAHLKGDPDITDSPRRFLTCLNGVFDHAETLLAGVLAKGGSWKRHQGKSLSNRYAEH